MPITDARTLRAMAHPVREKLFYELFARGSARVTDLAQALDLPVNQVSFHLRTMAKYGFIAEAPGEAKDRRERVWQPASQLGFDPAPELITRHHVESARRANHRLVDAFFVGAQKGPRASRDVSLQLTDEEFDQLTDELTALLMRWNRRGQDTVSGGKERRRTYLANLYLQPLP